MKSLKVKLPKAKMPKIGKVKLPRIHGMSNPLKFNKN